MTISRKTKQYRAYLQLGAVRNLQVFVAVLETISDEWKAKGQKGQLQHLNHSIAEARMAIFALADIYLAELKSVSGGLPEFQSMAHMLTLHVGALKRFIESTFGHERVPTREEGGSEFPLDHAFDKTFENILIELTFWLDKERFDYDLPAPAPEVKQERHGRHPAAFWDELWAEIARQLYLGDMVPKNQAQVEKAMLDWAVSKGVNVSESSVRSRARKLWIAISHEGKNETSS